MKLNNKGFAITSVLYGLLILFVVMMSSYLTVLSAKKNRLDNIAKEIEDSYTFNTEETINDITFPYTVPYTGKYVFSNNCSTYLFQGEQINSASDITFTADNCNVTDEVTIYYHKENNDE